MQNGKPNPRLVAKPPRKNALRDTLLDTTHGQSHFRVGQFVATIVGPRRYGWVTGFSEEFGMPRDGKRGHGSHVPVTWDGGADRSAVPRAHLEHLYCVRNARIRHKTLGWGGMITSRSLGVALSMQHPDSVLVRWDNGEEVPVEEKDLTVIANPLKTAP